MAAHIDHLKNLRAALRKPAAIELAKFIASHDPQELAGYDRPVKKRLKGRLEERAWEAFKIAMNKLHDALEAGDQDKIAQQLDAVARSYAMSRRKI